MPDQVIHFKASALARIIMLAMVLLALFASWFVVRWYLGNTLAEYFNPEESRLSTARMAASLAPSDPLTHWRLGDFILKQLPADQVAQAVVEFERSVSLSPNDYRYWVAWGQALEQAGEYEKAEKALREAVRLAPAYSFPRWHLGNLLLRRERSNEAFSELKTASQANEQLQPQLFALAWQVYGDDFEALKTAVGNEAITRARFAQYLIRRSQFHEGLKIWNTLNENEKAANRSVVESAVPSLVSQKRFHTAAGLWNEVAPNVAYRAEPGQIVDAGFENDIRHGPEFLFGWQVPSSNQVQIGITTNEGHNSNRSLRIFFQVRSQLESIDVKQLVMVRPDTNYNLECYVKTEKLVGASTPVIWIEDASDGTRLAASANVPNGDNGWQLVSLPFKSGPKTEAVQVRMVRTACTQQDPVCPIYGTVWYDNFTLKPGR